jgi:hypothetical protein
LSTLIRLAEAGIGLSVMPVRAVEENVRRGNLVAVPSDLPPFDNPLVMIRHYTAVDPAIASVAAIVRASAGTEDATRKVGAGQPGGVGSRPCARAGNAKRGAKTGPGRPENARRTEPAQPKRNPVERGQSDRNPPEGGQSPRSKPAWGQAAHRHATRSDANSGYPPRTKP